MKARQWPFEGDSPVARARKVALAYRQYALRLEKAIASIDPRVANGWVDDEAFKELYAAARNPEGSGCEKMDERFYNWGEEWHAPKVVRHYEDDEWITTEEAAGILDINGGSVSRMRARGRLEGKFVRPPGANTGRWYYLAGEVYRVSKEPRGRGVRYPDTTVKVHASGSSDAE